MTDTINMPEIYLPLDQAAAIVKDGDTLALGGMTLYRRPVGFVKALLARPVPPRDLTLLSFNRRAGI